MKDGYGSLKGGQTSSLPPLANAYPGSRQVKGGRSFWKVWLVAADCCLIGLQPVLIHLSKGGKDRYAYHPLSVNVLVEVVRTLFALTVLATSERSKKSTALPGSSAPLWKEFRRNKALLIPAAMYSLNGYLKFMMQLYFKPTTAKMLANLKILVIAVLMRNILRRQFSTLQWEALLLLTIGITVNQLDHCMEGGLDLPPGALLCTAASLVIPSLASVFNEWALKRRMETSVHVQNFFLYLGGLGFNLIGLLLVASASERSLRSMFQGHSRFTLMLIVNNALQGILSSLFFKYADTILKKYSSTIATVWTALLSAALFGHRLTLNLLLAIITVFCSMHIFFGQGALKNKKPADGQERSRDEARGLGASRSRSSSEDLIALEADLGDPDNMHLPAQRRPLLPK